MIIKLNKDNFKKTIKVGIVLIDFWAEWCGPCQAMLPILDTFSEQIWNKVIIWKVNVDENPEIASEFKVMSIPTIMVFKDWKLMDSLIWWQTIEKLNEICNKYL